jgi:hypothetical protein
MAKSLRAHCKRRARTLMRETVGRRQEDKVLRKVTRRTAHALLASGEASQAAVVALLGGVGGASRHLVTLAPAKRRALPFHFNPSLRASRLASGLEDDTDSEEEADGSGRVNEKGEPALGEPIPTGAATASAGNAGHFGAAAAGGGGGGGGGGMEGEEAEEGEEELEGDLDDGEEVVEQSGRKMAAGRPAGKRDMSDRYYDAQMKDLVNPLVAGFYSSEVPKGRKAAAKAARAAKAAQRRGGRGSSFIPVHKQ